MENNYNKEAILAILAEDGFVSAIEYELSQIDD